MANYFQERGLRHRPGGCDHNGPGGADEGWHAGDRQGQEGAWAQDREVRQGRSDLHRGLWPGKLINW